MIRIIIRFRKPYPIPQMHQCYSISFSVLILQFDICIYRGLYQISMLNSIEDELFPKLTKETRRWLTN